MYISYLYISNFIIIICLFIYHHSKWNSHFNVTKFYIMATKNCHFEIIEEKFIVISVFMMI